MNFNLFPKKKSVDEILETDEFLYDSIKKEANDLASGVVNGVYEIIALKNELQHQLDENVKLKEENKNLEDILKSIEEDGTTEHNNAINLRESVAHLRKEAEKFYNENIQLTKEVRHLRHLKTENVELIERLQKEGKSYGINFNEAKTQIIQNDYKKCAEERDEYKHQLDAANKEIEALKKEKKESFEILKKAIEDESARFHKLVVEDTNNWVNLNAANKELEILKEESKIAAEEIRKFISADFNFQAKIKKLTEENNILGNNLRDYQDKYAESFSYHDMKKLQNKIEDLTLMYKERETKLKTYNRSLQCQIISLKEEKEAQKHPMYPLHWGGYDKNIIDFVESEFSNVDPLEGKQVEFNAEELLKRVTEYADTLNDLPKSFPDEFQDDKTTAENLEERFDEGKDVLDYFEKPWKCPCNKCKESKNEKSWEEVASDLALKVAKLERMIEELKVVKANRDPNYDYFMKNGKWPWHKVENNS
jgi:myosin heavy subunit